jgi:hypothetical protein
MSLEGPTPMAQQIEIEREGVIVAKQTGMEEVKHVVVQ